MTNYDERERDTRATEDLIGDVMTSAKPINFRPNDPLHAAVGQCTGRLGKPGEPCPHVGLPGTIPPLCRSHGGLAPLTAAAAAIRLESLKQRVQTELTPAVVMTIQRLLDIVSTNSPFLAGTTQEIETVSNSGRVVTSTVGVKITAGDILRAADRILALAGITPEVTSLSITVADPAAASATPGGPVDALQTMLREASDDRLERLAARLGAIETRETRESHEAHEARAT